MPNFVYLYLLEGIPREINEFAIYAVFCLSSLLFIIGEEKNMKNIYVLGGTE